MTTAQGGPTAQPQPQPERDLVLGARAGAVDWGVAQRSAEWLIARRPAPPSYDEAMMEADFEELTAQAEILVAATTGLESPTPARARVTGRVGWVEANVASIQRLVGPVLERADEHRAARLAARTSTRTPILAKWPDLAVHTTALQNLLQERMQLDRIPRALKVAGRSASGAQIGLVLAWLSTRVLGQYDLLITDDVGDTQDLVYFVGPNIAALEARHDLDPRAFRLWIAIHEVTHRFQFTAVPWLKDHFVSLVNEGLDPFTSDPGRMSEVLRRVVEEVRAGRNPLDDSGMFGLVATGEQLEALRRIQALMSLLEGHGTATMNNTGIESVPGAPRFHSLLRERRQQVRGPARFLQQVIGMEAKARQYAEGERFVKTVEGAGGLELFNRVWRGPEWLPSLTEIRTPSTWMARVGAPPAAGSAIV